MVLIGSPVSEKTPSETVRKGVRVASEAFILVVSSSEIGPLRAFSSVFEASVSSLSGLFGQSQRNCLKILSTSQPPHHQPCHRRIDERFSGCAQPLVILAHPPVLRKPGEGPLHHPSTGQHLEAFRRHEPLPVYLLALLGPLFGPHPCHLLRRRGFGWLAHNLYTQAQGLFCPPPAPALVASIQPQVF